jgi:fumarate hydratase subunit alpha
MDKNKRANIINRVAEALIRASSKFNDDKKVAYMRAIETETNDRAKWALKTILNNAIIAEKNNTPLCDDTGIPHLYLEVGPNKNINGDILDAIEEGVAEGLKRLPGRPMAIMGNDIERLDQSGGLDENSAGVVAAPIIIKSIAEDIIRLHILMQGGGPAIRGRTYRVFHKHDIKVLTDEIVKWAIEAVKQLGCTPCTLAIGIGRSQFEATTLMIEAQIYGKHGIQNELESEITDRVNAKGNGILGLGGNTSVLSTFIKVGPQRASGVRIVSFQPCCCFEPRYTSIELEW